MSTQAHAPEIVEEPARQDGDALVELLGLFGWRVAVAAGRQATARATRGGLTLTARGRTRAEAILWLFEAAIEARHAAAGRAA